MSHDVSLSDPFTDDGTPNSEPTTCERSEAWHSLDDDLSDRFASHFDSGGEA